MTKHAAQPEKKHFEAVKASGAADKGNKVWRCKYCDQNRTGTASRLRDNFLKGACNVTRLRGTISKEELLRREQGRDAAIAELGGAVTGAGTKLDLSSREDEIGTEDAVTTIALTKSSTTHGRQTKIVDNAAIITANEQTQRTIDDWMTAECVPFNMMRSMYWDHIVKALMNAPKSFQYAKFDDARTKRVAVTRKRVSERMEQLGKEWPVSDCMLQLDRWTDRRGRPFINVMVSFPKGVVFWRAVRMQLREKGAKAYFDILSTAIREIREEAVEDPKKKPWRDGVGGLTAEQLCEDAKKRVQEWRANLRGDREEAEDCEDEDDDDDDGARDNVAKASTIARQRATSSLLELERELNKELPSWRKAIRPSKYLARLHLQESQHARKTMTTEHAEKYINARAQACAPNVKAPAKRGRPRKVAHVQGTEADGEQAPRDAEASERGSKQDAGLEVAAKGPGKRSRGRPRKVLREEEVQVDARETGEEGESSQKDSTKVGNEERLKEGEEWSTKESSESSESSAADSEADSEEEPLAKKKRRE
ncbi:hypothetical protein CBR_g4048 [Chara braunii]|uniref:DUF659 domain-containing protein n=1 Tax=Chara braunii TaxID=69332 RepID=A0A388KH12_CHABU|nr:hypothetical protein CBR_g4048 [Chara braunii]|eukprot:GBG69354.1 hypothetical protein CBR_g4048 [Chara braunii]